MEEQDVSMLDYIMTKEFTKSNKLIIIMSLIDVSNLFKAKGAESSGKFGKGGFSLMGRTSSMKRLAEELQNSADKKIRKHLTIQEFYHFYLYFKEIMPVMNHLSQKYHDSEDYIGVDNDENFLKIVLEKSSEPTKTDDDDESFMTLVHPSSFVEV